MGHKTRRLTPVTSVVENPGGYGGELCPFCRRTRMECRNQYPICHACQNKYGLTDEILRDLSGHRIKIDQDEIDWEAKPLPILSGLIDDLQWSAIYNKEKDRWKAGLEDTSGPAKMGLFVNSYLDLMTSVWVSSADQRRKTTICRYSFVAVAVGIGLVGAKYLSKRVSDRESKLIREAEKVSDPGGKQ